MSRCPYCGWEATSVEEEIHHMNSEHQEIVIERLRKAGFSEEEISESINQGE